jgi:hypothetical protein
MKLKTIEVEGTTYAAVDGGNPVYVDDDGNETALDAADMTKSIKSLRHEAMTNRQKLESAQEALKAFDGLEADKAREALEKLSQIDAKKLVDSGDMDAAIQTALKPVHGELTATKEENASLRKQLDTAVIGNAFGMSKYVADKLTPAGADLIRQMYGERIKVEGGKPIGYDQHGQMMYSQPNPGSAASFDEVVERFVNEYPHKDHILKGNNQSGSGSQGSGGGNAGAKTMSRSQYETMMKSDPAAARDAVKNGTVITD